MEKASFDWPIVLQYDVKAKCRLISRKFSGVTKYSIDSPWEVIRSCGLWVVFEFARQFALVSVSKVVLKIIKHPFLAGEKNFCLMLINK